MLRVYCVRLWSDLSHPAAAHGSRLAPAPPSLGPQCRAPRCPTPGGGKAKRPSCSNPRSRTSGTVFPAATCSPGGWSVTGATTRPSSRAMTASGTKAKPIARVPGHHRLQRQEGPRGQTGPGNGVGADHPAGRPLVRPGPHVRIRESRAGTLVASGAGLRVAGAGQRLEHAFPDRSCDVVFSHGVLHHVPGSAQPVGWLPLAGILGWHLWLHLAPR